jgi:hypothetical protein
MKKNSCEVEDRFRVTVEFVNLRPFGHFLTLKTRFIVEKKKTIWVNENLLGIRLSTVTSSLYFFFLEDFPILLKYEEIGHTPKNVFD